MSNRNGITPDRLYILVRRDLASPVQTVQACHALAELMCKHKDDP
ncbi:MAG TPA: hypothetical protein VLB68_12375 [Pyrinomonadaceae bacterium]|nr:hypothetical protein [Pyrinomonadaceae bacterium]